MPENRQGMKLSCWKGWRWRWIKLNRLEEIQKSLALCLVVQQKIFFRIDEAFPAIISGEVWLSIHRCQKKSGRDYSEYKSKKIEACQKIEDIAGEDDREFERRWSDLHVVYLTRNVFWNVYYCCVYTCLAPRLYSWMF